MKDTLTGASTGPDVSKGFDGTSVYTGEEKPYERKFGAGDSEGEADTATEGDAKTATQGDVGTVGKEKREGTEDGGGTGKGTNDLDPATALASFLQDPGSLAENGEQKTGKTGVPLGSKSGFLSGGLAKILTIALSAFDFLGGQIKKLFGKLKGLGEKALDAISNRLRKLRGVPGVKALPLPAKLRSGEIGDKIIGWGRGQATDAVIKTRQVTEALTKGKVKEMIGKGLTKEWVEEQLESYTTNALKGGAKWKNSQLFVRKELMERILSLWPK